MQGRAHRAGIRARVAGDELPKADATIGLEPLTPPLPGRCMRHGPATRFDGVLGWFAARVMARTNRAAELEGIELLAPPSDASVLAIGYGPGVGVQRLALRLATGRVVGVDPSQAMQRLASKRCRADIEQGRIELLLARADSIPIPDRSFDGALAINTLQLCNPLADTAAELKRVLRPGARLVSITHEWALRRRAGSVEAWVAEAREAFAAHGFRDIVAQAARAEKGRAIAVTLGRGGQPIMERWRPTHLLPTRRRSIPPW